MKTKNYLGVLALLAAAAFVGCDDDNPKQPELEGVDYANSYYWYQTGKQTDPTLSDVFYVIPTAGEDWQDANGEVHHHLDVNNSDHREAMENRFAMAYPIFGDSANFFSPYYRQITLQVWAGGEEAINKYYPTTFTDVKAAFDYYMKHWNGGRQFVLAGFSQGANDIGVTISYSSVDNEEGIGNLFRHSKMIINPANWSTGTDVAQVNDTVTNYISKEHMMLFVDGVDPTSIFQPDMSMLFPLGNFHLLELPLYAPYLRENVKKRLYHK